MDETHQPNAPRALWPVFVFALLALMLFFIASKLLPLLGGPLPDEDAARSAERAKAYADLTAEDTQKLGSYAWVDRAKGSVQVPVEVAIKLAQQRLAAIEPGTPAPVVEPATPAPVVEPVPAATPAVESVLETPAETATP